MKGCLILILAFLSDAISAQEVYREGHVSTDLCESYLTISSYGKELFFVRSQSFYEPAKKTIYHSKQIGLEWTDPKVAPFSGEYSDSSPFLTYDDKWIYFSSNRPAKNKKGSDSDIWRVPRLNDDSWGKPEHIGFDVNSSSPEYSPSLDLEGNLYFGSTRNKDEWGNLFYARRRGKSFELPIELPKPINSKDGEWGSCISPNGDFIVFESNGRSENMTYDGDLFIAWNKNGVWESYKHLPINSTKSDLSPRIFQDTRGEYYLFFASNRNLLNADSNDVDIYSYSLKIDELE